MLTFTSALQMAFSFCKQFLSVWVTRESPESWQSLQFSF